jgi:hypothetical protein
MLVSVAKTEFPQFKFFLSGVLRHRDVSLRRIGALNVRYDLTGRINRELTFVDPNSWIENWDFGRDGLHLNQSGARRLSHLYSRVCGFGVGRLHLNEWLLLSTNSEGTPDRTRKTIP